MANAVWHTGYGIEINLSLPYLGDPGRPDLLREITASVAERDPQLLECLAHHYGRECLSETGGKSPWMFIRRGRVGGRRPLVASHLPITHKATPAESAQRWVPPPPGLEVLTEQRTPLPPQRGRRALCAMHADWFVPALCLPEKKSVHIEDLILQSATGESVPVYVPSRGNG